MSVPRAASLCLHRHPLPYALRGGGPYPLRSQRRRRRTLGLPKRGVRKDTSAGKGGGERDQDKSLSQAATAELAPGEERTWGRGEKHQLQKQTGRWTSQAEAFSRSRFHFQNYQKCLFKGPLVSNKPNLNGKSQMGQIKKVKGRLKRGGGERVIYIFNIFICAKMIFP